MTKEQRKALEAVRAYQDTLLEGTLEMWRAKIAYTMLATVLLFTKDDLRDIDEVINR